MVPYSCQSLSFVLFVVFLSNGQSQIGVGKKGLKFKNVILGVKS